MTLWRYDIAPAVCMSLALLAFLARRSGWAGAGRSRKAVSGGGRPTLLRGAARPPRPEGRGRVVAGGAAAIVLAVLPFAVLASAGFGGDGTRPRCPAGDPGLPSLMPSPRIPGLHPWHDIPTGPNPPHEVTAVIEIPTNERNKYELDKTLGIFRLDRVLYSAVHYPGDYGFLPRTLGDDGDPLDVLVLMTIPVFTGCLVDARPIGLFHLVDRGAADEKVLAVPMRDPYSDGLNDLGDIPQHYLKEIEHFFQVYKDLEGTRTETRGFEGAEAARRGDPARRWRPTSGAGTEAARRVVPPEGDRRAQDLPPDHRVAELLPG